MQAPHRAQPLSCTAALLHLQRRLEIRPRSRTRLPMPQVDSDICALCHGISSCRWRALSYVDMLQTQCY